MRLTALTSILLLSPLALATPNTLASESTDTILRRDPTPMKPLMARSLGQSPANLLARSPQNDDSCESDERRCGNACVDEDYNCCPSNVSGGCPSDEECQEDDGRWGCCPEGDDCSWDDDNDDDDDDGLFDGLENFGDDVEDGWNDFWDGDEDAAGVLKPGVGVALVAALVAAVLPY
ncbi:hypothetical protein BDW59DRAFT_159181 [Aspergillus cavernicola]|uniref:GPI anchored protein n=1 Tax=Aspergillus cavernicola TaxID=176166 RepID=A0ABR4IN54_9EURO